MMNFWQTLLNFSERAAKIARTVRHDPCLFDLLVEEKGELQKNSRFFQDFKTLADVLIQETLRYYVSLKFPKIADCVKGEESSSFTNTLGESINVRICSTPKDTANLLAKVLNGNVEAANILSEIVHEKVEEVVIEEELKEKFPYIPLENIGIWIDPIDSTGEYINGKRGEVESSSTIFHSGLQCVTVLVGVYDKNTGYPIAGIVNQPFAHEDSANLRWISQIYWGLYYNDLRLHSNSLKIFKNDFGRPFIVVSSNETQQLQDKLKQHFGVVDATGAGYKSLTVAMGLAEAYFCSKGTTYRWDTCAPHGILRSLGGGIISYQSLTYLGQSQLLSASHLEEHQLKYHVANGPSSISSCSQIWCNKDGLVVYRNPDILNKIYESIKNVHR